jgi:hypothetical protein
MRETLIRAVWLLFVFGKHSILRSLGEYKPEQFERFIPYIVRPDSRMEGEELLFLTLVPCSIGLVAGLERRYKECVLIG